MVDMDKIRDEKISNYLFCFIGLTWNGPAFVSGTYFASLRKRC